MGLSFIVDEVGLLVFRELLQVIRLFEWQIRVYVDATRLVSLRLHAQVKQLVLEVVSCCLLDDLVLHEDHVTRAENFSDAIEVHSVV
jgi:uncharacterized membrane protein